MDPVRAKRIAVDARWVFRELSGIGRYTLELLRELGEIGGAFHFLVLVRDAERRAFIAREAGLADRANFEFAELPHGVFSPLGQFAAARLLRERMVDIYHSTNFMIPLPAFPRHRPHAIRCVCNIHDLIPLVHPEFTPRALKTRFYPVYKALMHQIARRVDTVVTGSESARRDIVRLLGIPGERIVVAPDGVAAHYGPAGEKPSARGGPKTVLYVGRSDPYKNLPGLVAVFARLVRETGMDVRLRIVGSPDARYPEAGEAARRLGVADRVEWSGYLDEAGLLKAYQEADVLALLSRYEGFGLPVLEAMACGTPVVCSDAASLPEVVGGAAWLVNPDDQAEAVAALREVLTNPAAAERLRTAGLERARQFTWQAAAAAVLRVYGGAP
ncbi:MAG: glycosyltransferase family 4 protein [Lentisphaerae bacterium]|jgi:glycosyltransferase involved in cell wall biosynthesis|nr:glycosyltransferase family 4 protein [Lentisphaerota bacterium]HQQ60481.1 glycosyltransferase family 1 protein [Kiritimatiellia bacterium]